MGNIDYGKLQDSLETIKTICEDHIKDGCNECPLGDRHGTCKLSICPCEWMVRHPETDAFRVLE